MRNAYLCTDTSYTCILCVHLPTRRPSIPILWVFWHVLNETQSAFESNHCFIHRYLLGENTIALKVREQGLDEWPEFVKRVVSWLSFLYVSGTIVQVEKPEDESESIPLHDLITNISTLSLMHYLTTYMYSILTLAKCVFEYGHSVDQ